MAFTTERITDMICRRLEEYGYDYGGRMSPKLYPIYLKVAGVIQIRLGLPRGFVKTNQHSRSGPVQTSTGSIGYNTSIKRKRK